MVGQTSIGTSGMSAHGTNLGLLGLELVVEAVRKDGIGKLGLEVAVEARAIFIVDSVQLGSSVLNAG